MKLSGIVKKIPALFITEALNNPSLEHTRRWNLIAAKLALDHSLCLKSSQNSVLTLF